jgi:hypothetical protein
MSALILKAANEFSVLFLGTSRSDDSAGDRLSYRYTCAILVAFTIVVSNREFTSKRIQCWVYRNRLTSSRIRSFPLSRFQHFSQEITKITPTMLVNIRIDELMQTYILLLLFFITILGMLGT